MEEPKKVLHVDYLGSVEVNKACGMEVLNSAIDQLANTIPKSQWQMANVAIAPSMITITPNVSLFLYYSITSYSNYYVENNLIPNILG
jgi:hypothetical protein